MVTIKIKEENNIINEVAFTGHCADTNVCAAVSALSIATANYIELIEDTIETTDIDGTLTIKVIHPGQYTEKILRQMLNMLKDIKTDYPDELAIDGALFQLTANYCEENSQSVNLAGLKCELSGSQVV